MGRILNLSLCFLSVVAVTAEIIDNLSDKPNSNLIGETRTKRGVYDIYMITEPDTAPAIDTTPEIAPAVDSEPKIAPAVDTAPEIAPAIITGPEIASAVNTEPKIAPAVDTNKIDGDPEGVGDGRSNVIKVLDIGHLADTQRNDIILPQLDLAGVVTTIGAAILLAFWITIAVYFAVGFQRRVEDDYFAEKYGYHNFQGQFPGNNRNNFGERVSRVIDHISPDSFQFLVNSINSLDPRPSIARMGTGAVESVGGLLSSTLVQGAGVLSQVTDTLSGVPDVVSGGVDRVSKTVGDSNFQDCLLQSVCYLSAPETDYIENKLRFKRMLDAAGISSKFEGRKLNNKKNGSKEERRKIKEEKRKKKEEKRKKKKKEEEEKKKEEEDDEYEYEDYYDEYEDEDEDEDEVEDEDKDNDNNNEKDEKDEKKKDEKKVEDEVSELKVDDCDVFNCSAARIGHSLLSLYQRINAIRSSRISNDVSEDDNKI